MAGPMSAATPYLKLPLTFDVERMRAELAAIAEDAWISHYNTGAYESGWRCVPLRSVDGRADHIMALEEGAYQDTHWLQRCPCLREVIASFQCETTSVRLMALDAGAVVREHRDPGTAMEEGITRIHVPIATTPEAIMRIEGEVVHFAAGHAWYLNAACLHGVENRGSTPRVHLMIDCVTNPWVEALFREAGGVRQQPLTAHERSLLRGAQVQYEPGQGMRGWYPVTITTGPRGVPQLGWRHLGEKPLTAAFFEDSLAAQPREERRVCHTPLAALQDVGECVEPTAFVLHVSRCGSTLLTQMLATAPEWVVLSEPPGLDAFLRYHHHYPQSSGGASALRGVVAALTQRRTGLERHAIIKCDSWHMPWAAWLREVFPRTPIVLLYRDPAEVLLSHVRQRGRHMVPGMADTSGLQPDLHGVAPGDLDGYALRVLDAIYASALEAAALSGVELVNYTQLPGVVLDEMLPRWGVKPDAARMDAMRARAAFHSKHPTSRFEGDPAEEAGLREAASCSPAMGSYEKLEALRLAAGRA
jgi:hypothetical protein